MWVVALAHYNIYGAIYYYINTLQIYEWKYWFVQQRQQEKKFTIEKYCVKYSRKRLRQRRIGMHNNWIIIIKKRQWP